jgi:hypothetical protein
MLEDELRRLLHELLDATGAELAAIELRPEPDAAEGVAAASTATAPGAADGTAVAATAGDVAAAAAAATAAAATAASAATAPGGDGDTVDHVVPLGGGSVLRVVLPASAPPGEETAGVCERAARAIRAAARRWEVARLPPVALTRDHQTSRDRVRARIEAFLVAFANAPGVANAAVTRAGDVIASAAPLAEAHRLARPRRLRRLPVVARRHRGETAHVEIVNDDVAVFAFWVDACLLAFFDGPHSADFVRHRARLVARELSSLLPELDEPPDAPAAVAPRPE